MNKVLFVATVVKNHIMEFHIPYLKMLKEHGWETAVAAKNDFDDPADCVIPYCDFYYDVPFERNPLKFQNIMAYRMLKKIVDDGKYDIIHCHTPVGAMIARLAAINARKWGTCIIYTAHGFHFFKGAPLLNWLVYYPIERVLSRFTDVLISINREDYERAKRFHAKEVRYVPGVGIDLQRFNCDEAKHQEARRSVRAACGIPDDAFILLSIGDVNANKNHRFIIDMLAGMRNPKIYYIVCGCGELIAHHKRCAMELGIGPQVHFMGYRNDIVNFYWASDVLVFPSLREGLPVTVMEAMASGLPCVVSDIRGSRDLVADGENGFVLPLCMLDWQRVIQQLYKEPTLRQSIANNGLRAADAYTLDSIVPEVLRIYFDHARV